MIGRTLEGIAGLSILMDLRESHNFSVNPLNGGSNFIYNSLLTQKLFHYQCYQLEWSK